jgi:hypothetical protein
MIPLLHREDLIDLTSYLAEWNLAEFFTIYKKGSPSDVNNYRGISILVASKI